MGFDVTIEFNGFILHGEFQGRQVAHLLATQ